MGYRGDNAGRPAQFMRATTIGLSRPALGPWARFFLSFFNFFNFFNFYDKTFNV